MLGIHPFVHLLNSIVGPIITCERDVKIDVSLASLVLITMVACVLVVGDWLLDTSYCTMYDCLWSFVCKGEGTGTVGGNLITWHAIWVLNYPLTLIGYST